MRVDCKFTCPAPDLLGYPGYVTDYDMTLIFDFVVHQYLHHCGQDWLTGLMGLTTLTEGFSFFSIVLFTSLCGKSS
jgi:hypothetical protein